MNHNLAQAIETAASRIWCNSINHIDLKQINNDAIQPEFIEETSELRLITSSGFEQAYVLSSQIASW